MKQKRPTLAENRLVWDVCVLFDTFYLYRMTAAYKAILAKTANQQIRTSNIFTIDSSFWFL